MKILAVERALPGATARDFQRNGNAEDRRAWQLCQEGIFRELYFRQDQPSAVLVLECADVEQAEEVLKTLPLVQAGLIAFDLIPLRAYPGFERLFYD